MNFDDFNKLTPEEKKPFQSDHRKCECDEPLVSVNGHSTGDLHTMCPKCKTCPDCDDGE